MDEKDYEIWDLRNDFSLAEAAALWFDVNPNDKEEVAKHHAKIATMQQVFFEALVSLKIPMNRSISAAQQKKPLHRAGLKAYAKSIGQKPKFLFTEEREKSAPQAPPLELSNGDECSQICHEDFISNLKVSYENDEQINIQEPGKTAKPVTCQSLGFRNKSTKEWKTLLEILRSTNHIYWIGVQGRSSKVRNKDYDAQRKRLESINKKLVEHLNRNYSITLPDDYRLYELHPGEKKGTYRFKFQIVDDSGNTKETANKETALSALKDLIHNGASAKEQQEAATFAMKHGATKDEITATIKAKLHPDSFKSEFDEEAGSVDNEHSY